MTAFTFDSDDTIETAKKEFCIDNNRNPQLNWDDLEELCRENVTVCTSDIECMVSKHLLVGRADLGVKYYEKLRKIVKNKPITPLDFLTGLRQKKKLLWKILKTGQSLPAFLFIIAQYFLLFSEL